jgi:hypothetical protein
VRDYYAAAAQLIPLLVLALLVHQRISGSDENNEYPGWRAVVILGLGALSFLAEGTALQVLLEDGQGSPEQAGAVASAIAGLTLILLVITAGPPIKEWAKKPHKKLDRLRSRLHLNGDVVLALIAGALCGLIGVAYEWGEAHAPEEKQAKPHVEQQGKP